MLRVFLCFLMVFPVFAVGAASVLSDDFTPRVKVLSPKAVRLYENGRFCQDLGHKGSTERLVAVLRREWTAFGKPVYDIAAKLPTNLPPELNEEMDTFDVPQVTPRLMRSGKKEDSYTVTERIGSYWATVPNAQDFLTLQNKIWQLAPYAGWADAWSAAFISYAMCEAGVREEDFPRSASHVDYVKAVVAGKSDLFRPLSLAQAGRLQVGDVVCADRGRQPYMTQKTVLQQKFRPLHCDVVVGHGQGNRVKLIGGNVKDAVTMTVSRLVPNPKRKNRWMLEASDHRRWFVVLRPKAP